MTPSGGGGRPGRSLKGLGRGRRKPGAKSPRKKGLWKTYYAHILFGLVVVGVLVFIFTREDSEPTEPNPTTTTATVATTRATQIPDTTVPPTTTTAISSAAVATTVTTAPPEPPQTVDQPTMSYMEGLAGFKQTLADLVEASTAASQAWDNRTETGATYRETSSILVDVVERTRAFAEAVRDYPVPSSLVPAHEGPDGPVEQAAGLVPLAEAVLAGLRLPTPDDGSTRRAAVADFNTAADDFAAGVDTVTAHIDENAEDLGLTVDEQAAPPTVPEPSEEATTYIERLSGFKDTLADLVTAANAANQAWDNRTESGVTYRETDTALVGITGRARSFHDQVRDHPVPSPVATLGRGPVDQAARLAPLADAVLEGLRIPAPDDGSGRRTALADFNTAADDFAAGVDEVIRHIEENFEALGLVKDG